MARRPRVACTAPPAYPELEGDWPLLRAALAHLDVQAETVVWSDPATEWSSYDLVVANGVWDYIHDPASFIAWTERLAGAPGTRVVNDPAVLRWNVDKRYLRDLERAGVPVVPTTWMEPGRAAEALEFPDGEIVVKPAISGGGFSTARYEPHERVAASVHVERLNASGRTALVQPYQAAVDREGETGLVFLGGTFSHALHKAPMIRRGIPPQQDLVENQVVTAGVAEPPQLALGRLALAAAESLVGPTTYARVDMVRAEDGTPLLLELELLDPVLFLRTHPNAPATFARVLRQQLEE